MYARVVRTAWLAIVAAFVVVSGCDRPNVPSKQDELSGRLIIAGSSTLAPLVSEIGKRFESLHPGVRIDVQTGGSSRGITDARRGTADIGLVSRALKPEESDLVAHAVALDAVIMIVHRDNAINELSREQITGIYTGQITHWSELGGKDRPITVLNKAEGRATLELFLAYLKLKNSDIRAGIIIGDNQQGIRTVVGNPHAIGYVSVGTAEFASSRGVPIRMLPLDGIAPTLANIRNGLFPMSRPLNLVTYGPVSQLARAFIAYAASNAVNDLVEAQYFVPVSD